MSITLIIPERILLKDDMLTQNEKEERIIQQLYRIFTFKEYQFKYQPDLVAFKIELFNPELKQPKMQPVTEKPQTIKETIQNYKEYKQTHEETIKTILQINEKAIVKQYPHIIEIWGLTSEDNIINIMQTLGEISDDIQLFYHDEEFVLNARLD